MALFKDCNYINVNTTEKLTEMLKELKGQKLVVIDLETTGLSALQDYVVGIGLSWQERTGYYIPLNHNFGINLPYEETLEILKPYLENTAVTFIAHNKKFDNIMLAATDLTEGDIKDNPNFVTDLWLTAYFKELTNGLNIDISDQFKKMGISCNITEDTMIFSYLIGKYASMGGGDAMVTASLKKIVKLELGIQMVHLEELFGLTAGKSVAGKKAKDRKASIIKFETLDPEQEIKTPEGTIVKPYEYGAADCDMTLRLRNKFYNQVKGKFLFNVDHGITPMVKLMELNGVLCNVQEMNRQYKYLTTENAKLQNIIYRDVSKILGFPVTFDLGSSHQVGKMLFDQLKYPVQERSPKTGKPLTNATVLEAMSKDFPLVKNILNWRSIRKNAEDFFLGMQAYINKLTGRIHTSYATAHVISGRFASSDPNMQNQAKQMTWFVHDTEHSESGYKVYSNVRQCYTPPKDFYILEGDFSQIEYRVFAGMSQAHALLKAYEEGADFHTRNASMIFQIPEADVSKKLRSEAKQYSFGIMYGMREAGIALRTGRDKKECKKFIQNYFAAIPEAVRHIQDVTDQALVNGYVETHFGRIAYIPEFKSDNRFVRAKGEREAFSISVQGCISYDSKVVTLEDGFISIGDILGSKETDWSEIPVGQAKTVTIWEGYKYVPALAAYSGMKQQVKIRFKDGSFLITSPEHKFLRENEYQGTFWREAKDLKGQFASTPDAVVIGSSLNSGTTGYTDNQVYFSPMVKGTANNALNYDANDIFKLEPFEAGVLLGRLATDGTLCLREDGGCVASWLIAEHEKEILPYLESLIQQIGWDYKSFKKDRTQENKLPLYYINVGSKSLVRQLVDSDIKHAIPKQVSCNIEILRGYLRGFIDGDGGISGDSIQITFGRNEEAGFENKEPWAQDIQAALRFFGIRSSLGVYERSIRLRLRKGHNIRFYNTIGFINPVKTSKLLSLTMVKRELRDYQRVESVEMLNTVVPMFDIVNCPDEKYSVNGFITHNTAADLLRIALVRLTRALVKNFGYRFNDFIRPMLTTHDSIALAIHRSVDLDKLLAVMKAACEVPVKGFPHLAFEFSLGLDYGNLIDLDDIKPFFNTESEDFGFSLYHQSEASKKSDITEPINDFLEDCTPTEINEIDTMDEAMDEAMDEVPFDGSELVQESNPYKLVNSLDNISQEQQVIGSQNMDRLKEDLIGQTFKLCITAETIDLPAMLKFKQLLSSNPGNNQFVVQVGDKEMPVGTKTSLSFKELSMFQSIFPCTIAMDKKSVSSKSLISGLNL